MLPIFHRRPAATAVPSLMGDIKDKSIGFQKKYHMAPECPKASRLAHGGETHVSSFNHVFNMFMTLFDLFDLGLTQN